MKPFGLTVIKHLLCSGDEQTAGRIFARNILFKIERNQRTGFKCSRLCQVKTKRLCFVALILEADPACFTGCLPCQSMETMNR